MKRRILIAEDEFINREILKELLQNDYDLIFACDGGEALDIIRANKETISLILLDILMPVMSGTEVLKAVKEDPELSRIPVIVATSEKDTEVESLRLGAADFIPKPYPAIDVINARILRTIELSEDRDIIQSTERDALTGLYNKEFFFRYAAQFDSHNRECDTDAAIVDINHFRMVNERYGKAYGDEVLSRVAGKLREAVTPAGGLVCRQEADTFLIYSPHREDYDAMLDDISESLAKELSDNRVRLRMGIYYHADKSIDIERRFDRAKMAADTVRGTFNKTIGIYDIGMHESQLYAEQLIEDFPAAIRDNQFVVYYQPKFDIRPDVPILASAEALVRWIHPELGMISPGLFIPLFEENGLIQQLDEYVWKETARQIRSWKKDLNCSIPVSVNVSRIDLYDPAITEKLSSIISEQGLTGSDMLLEVTESAYTRDSVQIIDAVNKLRNLGFKIEMDDFGTGYSSLNMISSLPIDALKLDMQFVRNAFKEGGDTHMVEVIIGISDFLSVPVIAEGVETESQLHALKNLGCDLVQGYFFSKPVPAREFEPFILQKKEADLAAEENARKEEQLSRGSDEKIRHAKLEMIQGGEVSEEDEDEQTDHKSEINDVHKGINLKGSLIIIAIIAVISAAALLLIDLAVTQGYERMVSASERYVEAQKAASDMESGSDYLTDRVRSFVVTGDIVYLNDFIEEIEVTERRDKAVSSLEELMGDSENTATASLRTALTLSNELINYENKAMRLIIESGEYDLSEIPESILNVELTKKEKSLSPAELRREALSLVFDSNYMLYKTRIRDNVNMCTNSIIGSSSEGFEQASARLSLLVKIQTIMTILFLILVLWIVIMLSVMVRKPLSKMVELMQGEETIPPTGVEELRFVTRAYNQILKENKEARMRLSHEASHDALTGLLNRGAYDLLMDNARKDHIALIIVDVDYFKTVNDTYGHETGDRILKRVAALLKASFRSVDIICRFGGDEFTVVMTRVTKDMSQLVLNKMNRINETLRNPKDDLPSVSLSVGIAFSDPEDPETDLFKLADQALYRVKKAGRNGCAIYDEELDKND